MPLPAPSAHQICPRNMNAAALSDFADEDECAEAHQRPPAPVAALLAHSTERYSARS